MERLKKAGAADPLVRAVLQKLQFACMPLWRIYAQVGVTIGASVPGTAEKGSVIHPGIKFVTLSLWEDYWAV